MKNKRLREKINEAKAWGCADNESVGYSYVHWVRLIMDMEKYISTLEGFFDKEVLEEINKPSNFDDI